MSKLSPILKQLIQISINNRLSIISNLYLNPLQYAIEYKTVGIIVGRTIGKTRSIIEFVNSTKDSCLIITHNSQINKNFEEQIANSNCISITQNQIDRLCCGNKFQWIFFDESEYLGKDNIEEIYKLTVDSSNSLQTYIKLST